jgi:hypothetical protein
MLTTCKICDKSFKAQRAGAQYCSGRCRVAAYRQRQAPEPSILWLDGKRRRTLTNDDLALRLLELAEHGDGGVPKTGRRFYYLALSHGYIVVNMRDTKEGKQSRDSAYKRVTKKLGALRMAGSLGWDMVLDLTRELVEWETFTSPREARAAMRRRYDEDRWLGQKYFPVLVVEKDTLEPICRPIAFSWRMPFASSRGYSSLKLQHDVAKMLISRRAKTLARDLNNRFAQSGQIAVIYFLSDLDPSGLDLQRAWEEALHHFGVVCIFVRIGLTHDQVMEDDSLKDLAIEVKPSDSRSKAFVAEHGTRCWEADVLPAAVIEKTIDDEIRSWLDEEKWTQRADEIERARRLL